MVCVPMVDVPCFPWGTSGQVHVCSILFLFFLNFKIIVLQEEASLVCSTVCVFVPDKRPSIAGSSRAGLEAALHHHRDGAAGLEGLTGTGAKDLCSCTGLHICIYIMYIYIYIYIM